MATKKKISLQIEPPALPNFTRTPVMSKSFSTNIQPQNKELRESESRTVIKAKVTAPQEIKSITVLRPADKLNNA